MLLHLFNQREKEFFLELAYLVAKIDNEFAEEEKIIIQQYRREMNLEDIIVNSEKHSIEEILEFFKDSLIKIQRSIFIEIYALTLSDNKLQKEEENVLDLMQKKFSISDSIKCKTIKVVNDLNKLYQETLCILND